MIVEEFTLITISSNDSLIDLKELENSQGKDSIRSYLEKDSPPKIILRHIPTWKAQNKSNQMLVQ
jgi:hypothetical protein